MPLAVKARFTVVADTAANWTANNPVLARGEFGFEYDTNKFKIGDGTATWNSIATYFQSGAGGAPAWGAITGTLSAQSDLQAALDAKAALSHTHLLANVTDVTITAANLNALDDGVNTALHFHDADRARANHTGTQTASTISDFTEAVQDVMGGILFTSGDLTWTYNDPANTLSAAVANNAVTYAKMQDVSATARFIGRITAGAGDPEELTGTQATTLLDVFTSGLKGLAPASGGGTTNFLRADGTWAAPGGGGSGDVVGPAAATDNALARFDTATGKLIQNSGILVTDDGELDLPLDAAPTAPAADRLKIFAGKRGGRMVPRVIGPAGLDTTLQDHFGFNAIAQWQPAGNSTTVSAIGAVALTATGTATAATIATTNWHQIMRRIDYLVTTAATTAIAGFRGANNLWLVGGPAADQGGFFFVCRWGPATGVATATNRAVCGMSGQVGVPTDVEPSTLTNFVGMGWDAADANIQFMHNDGAGTCTKIDLGASFPVPTADRTKAYEIAMFSPPGTTQIVYWEVREIGTANVVSGSVNTNLPSTSTFLGPRGWMSVGGTSSVIGIALMNLYIESDY